MPDGDIIDSVHRTLWLLRPIREGLAVLALKQGLVQACSFTPCCGPSNLT